MEREARLARTSPDEPVGRAPRHDERFQRASRLRSADDFQRVRRAGKRRQGQYLTLGFARSELGDEGAIAPARVGFSVSKRVGDAVTRNRVKRRLREAVRRRLWQVIPGWDMIFTARPDAAGADYTALRDELDALLTQARLLKLADAPTNAADVARDETPAP